MLNLTEGSKIFYILWLVFLLIKEPYFEGAGGMFFLHHRSSTHFIF